MAIAQDTNSTVDTHPLRAGDKLPADACQDIRRRLVLDSCKWDPQVGDVATISPFPLLLDRTRWRQLSHLTMVLAEELLAAEQELLARPELHRKLGLPRGIRSVLRQAHKLDATPAAARVMRFDFHWTPGGWQISEVNSDCPGGYSEASELPTLMAAHYPDWQPAGNPGAAWAGAIAASASPGKAVALLAAAGFMEDQQVVAYLARLLRERGLTTHWALPQNLRWRQGQACLEGRRGCSPLGAIVRFFQAEWLNARSCSSIFVGGRTPVCNPGIAVLTESKRFPLVWDQLSADLSTWHQLLPATVDPRDADWFRDDSWLVKSALCDCGDTVAIRSLLSDDQWRSAARAVRRNPGSWVAQKRFATCPLQSPVGTIYPCIGVYAVNGSPAGIYGRFSSSPLIDFAAVDVAVLIASA